MLRAGASAVSLRAESTGLFGGVGGLRMGTHSPVWWSEANIQEPVLIFHLVLSQGLLCLYCFLRQSWVGACKPPGESPVSGSRLPLRVLGFQMCPTASGFLHGLQGSELKG